MNRIEVMAMESTSPTTLPIFVTRLIFVMSDRACTSVNEPDLIPRLTSTIGSTTVSPTWSPRDTLATTVLAP